MTIPRNLLCGVYALIGLVALIGCWTNNVQYMSLGVLGGNFHFWEETLVNPASRSITIDILFLSLAAIVWMLLEARRLSMPGVWLYILFGILVAISAAFPAFLIHRERALARRGGSTNAGTLSVVDIAGVVLLSVPVLTYTCVALSS